MRSLARLLTNRIRLLQTSTTFNSRLKESAKLNKIVQHSQAHNHSHQQYKRKWHSSAKDRKPPPNAEASTESRLDQRPPSAITRDEETSLADFLAVGLSLAEARAMKENEDKLASIKLQAREMKRQTQRGAIVSRGANSQTRFGPGSSAGRRGGLTFN